MPADLVTGVVLALERCAKTDPPTDSDARMTDIGVAYYVRDHRGEAWFYIEDDHATMPCDPQPRVWQFPHWYDFPRDTEGEPLTTEDLRLALAWGEGAYKRHLERRPHHFNPHIEAELQGEEPAKLEAFARLRAALDALDKGGR